MVNFERVGDPFKIDVKFYVRFEVVTAVKVGCDAVSPDRYLPRFCTMMLPPF
jgi:hypothetical protein